MTELVTPRSVSNTPTSQARDTNTSRSRLLSCDVQRELSFVSQKDFEEHLLRHRNLEAKVNELSSRVQYVNPTIVQHTWEELLKLRGLFRYHQCTSKGRGWSTYGDIDDDDNNNEVRSNKKKKRNRSSSSKTELQHLSNAQRFTTPAASALFQWDSDGDEESPASTIHHDNPETTTFSQNPSHMSHIGKFCDNFTTPVSTPVSIQRPRCDGTNEEVSDKNDQQQHQEVDDDVVSPITVVDGEEVWNTPTDGSPNTSTRQKEINVSLPCYSYSSSGLPPPPPLELQSYPHMSMGLSEEEVTKLIEDRLTKAVESLMKQIKINDNVTTTALQNSSENECDNIIPVDLTRIERKDGDAAVYDEVPKTVHLHQNREGLLSELTLLQTSVSSLEQQINDMREYTDACDNNFSDEIQKDRVKVENELSVVEEKLSSVTETATMAKREITKGLLELSKLQSLHEKQEIRIVNIQRAVDNLDNIDFGALKAHQEELSDMLMNQLEELEMLKANVSSITRPSNTDTIPTTSCTTTTTNLPNQTHNQLSLELSELKITTDPSLQSVMMELLIREFKARANIEHDEIRIRMSYQDSVLQRCISEVLALFDPMLNTGDTEGVQRIQRKRAEIKRYDPISPPWLFVDSQSTATPLIKNRSLSVMDTGSVTGTRAKVSYSNSQTLASIATSGLLWDREVSPEHFVDSNRKRGNTTNIAANAIIPQTVTSHVLTSANNSYTDDVINDVVDFICGDTATMGRIAEYIVESKQFDSAILDKVINARETAISTRKREHESTMYKDENANLSVYGSVHSTGLLPVWYENILDIISMESHKEVSKVLDPFKQFCSKDYVEGLVRDVTFGVMDKEVSLVYKEEKMGLKSIAIETMELIKNTGLRMMEEVEANVNLGKEQLDTHIKACMSKIMDNNTSTNIKEDTDHAATALIMRCEEKLKESLAIFEKCHMSENKNGIIHSCSELIKNVFHEELSTNHNKHSRDAIDNHLEATDNDALKVTVNSPTSSVPITSEHTTTTIQNGEIDSGCHDGKDLVVPTDHSHCSRNYLTPIRNDAQTGLNTTFKKDGGESVVAMCHSDKNDSDNTNNNNNNSDCCTIGKGDSDGLYYPHICTVVPLAGYNNAQALSLDQKSKYEEYVTAKHERETVNSMLPKEGVTTSSPMHYAHVKGVENRCQSAEGQCNEDNKNGTLSTVKEHHYIVGHSVLGVTPSGRYRSPASRRTFSNESYSRSHRMASPLPPPPPPSFFDEKDNRDEIDSFPRTVAKAPEAQSLPEFSNIPPRTTRSDTVNANQNCRPAGDFHSPSINRGNNYDDDSDVISGDDRRVLVRSSGQSHNVMSDNQQTFDQLASLVDEVLLVSPNSNNCNNWDNNKVNVGSDTLSSLFSSETSKPSTNTSNTSMSNHRHVHSDVNDNVKGGYDDVPDVQYTEGSRIFKKKEKEKNSCNSVDIPYLSTKTKKLIGNIDNALVPSSKHKLPQAVSHRDNNHHNKLSRGLRSSSEYSIKRTPHDIVQEDNMTTSSLHPFSPRNIASVSNTPGDRIGTHGMYAFNSQRNQQIIEEHFRRKERAMRQQAARNAISILREERNYRKV